MADLIERDAVDRMLYEYAEIRQVYNDMHDLLMKIPAIVNRWIPCSERLPEIWKEVLVVLNSNGYQSIHIGEMQESGDWMVSGEFWYDKGDPALTHWMPLPEPPEKE